MYSVVLLCCENLKVEGDFVVYTGFETENAAYNYAVNLLAANYVTRFGGGFYFQGEQYETAKDVVEAFQESMLGPSEYFHVVDSEVVNHESENSLPGAR